MLTAEEVGLPAQRHGVDLPPLDEIPTFLADGETINPEAILAARLALGDSRLSMARKIDVRSQQTIYRWETQNVAPMYAHRKGLLAYIEKARKTTNR